MNLFNRLYYRIAKGTIIHPKAEIGKGVKIGRHCIIGRCKIGSGSSIGNYCEIRESVIIGSKVIMGSRCTISAGGVIGSHCIIKYGFVLTDTPDLNDNESKKAGVVYGNAHIGANVTLMPGIEIGHFSTIGACSQVRNHVPSNEVWYGNPAKKMR